MSVARVLLLGGSTEASALARAAAATRLPIDLTVSFAGRTSQRGDVPEGVASRVGGFGGVVGLGDHLARERVDLVIDATHPFARQMPFHASEACAAGGVPLLRLVRPPWDEQPGDRWIAVADMAAAACAAKRSGAERILLTIGRQELTAFAGCDRTRLLVRSIDPPEPGALDGAEVLLARGPFLLDSEIELLRSRAIDLIVSKNSGGSATRAKIDAARSLGVPVVMVARPPSPAGESVTTASEALAWLRRRLPSAATNDPTGPSTGGPTNPSTNGPTSPTTNDRTMRQAGGAT
jgi:precorrin-6A/cobalt-precorrin-6A reductase